MRRGVNSHLFSPEKRNRTEDTFVIGFVGRLAAEKNVRFLPVLEQASHRRRPVQLQVRDCRPRQ